MPAVIENSSSVIIDHVFADLKKQVSVARREPIAERKKRLVNLKQWVLSNRAMIHQAAFNDFQKPAVEVDSIEIFHVINEINNAVDNLERWARPKKVDAPLTMLGTRSFIQYEPRGVCLIIAPWNYPFCLAVGPLISALAAGNVALLKPSEMTPHVSSVIKNMVTALFPSNMVAVIEGGPEISRHLLSLPFDHIFFTGSPAIGKVVMRAAAEHLTSVTLELGGKSPAIVTERANLNDAAQRIAVAKFVNNGQTCVAPDYVLVHEKLASALVEKLVEQTQKLFSHKGDFEKSESYCRIVNTKHFERITGLLQDALNKGANIELGGKVEASTRFIQPVILTDVAIDSRLMEEEIFGPILPVLTYSNIEEAIALVNSKPKALALYVFTNQSSVQHKILTETSAGGVCINDCAIHFLHHNLPFGGVNNSGMGKSHGYYGFLAFSNEKPVLRQKSGITSVKLFYPPYTSFSRKLMDWFLKLF